MELSELPLHTSVPNSQTRSINHSHYVQATLWTGEFAATISPVDQLIIWQHGAKNVVTLFHKPNNEASTRVLTLLKQANTQATAHATEDQASSHQAQDKAEKTDFELDVTEAPPTSDQLKNILEYLGGSASKVVQGASDEGDAQRRLKADGNTFQRPLVRYPDTFM
jgi:arsenate reductase-like glutaredoxin family protein